MHAAFPSRQRRSAAVHNMLYPGVSRKKRRGQKSQSFCLVIPGTHFFIRVSGEIYTLHGCRWLGMRYKINGSPSHTPPLLSGFGGGGAAAKRGAFFFLSPLLHTTLILWGKSSSFFSGRRRGTAPSSSEAPEAGLERQISASSARPPARSTDMHCTLQSHCKKSAIRANKKKPCLRKKNPRYFLFSSNCRHPHRSGVRVLRVLEGHLHQRHLGAQLHLAHRRQAVQGVLRKSRSFTFLGGSTVFFVEYVQISNSKFA